MQVYSVATAVIDDEIMIEKKGRSQCAALASTVIVVWEFARRIGDSYQGHSPTL